MKVEIASIEMMRLDAKLECVWRVVWMCFLKEVGPNLKKKGLQEVK